MPLLKYSLWRLLVLLACVGGLALAGLRGWLLLLVAVVLAALISYAGLAGPREASALYLAEQAERRRKGINSPRDDDADEDAEADRSRGQ